MCLRQTPVVDDERVLDLDTAGYQTGTRLAPDWHPTGTRLAPDWHSPGVQIGRADAATDSLSPSLWGTG